MMSMFLLFVSKLPSIICTIVSLLYSGFRALVDSLCCIQSIVNMIVKILHILIQFSTQARSLNNLVRIGYAELKDFGLSRKTRFEELVRMSSRQTIVCSDPVVKAQHDIDDLLSHRELVWHFMIESLAILIELDTYKAIVSYNLSYFDNMLRSVLSIVVKSM